MDEMNALERQLSGVVRGAMRPPRPVDATAIVRSATRDAPSGPWPVVARLRDRTSQAPTATRLTMHSALKFVAAAVIVALFGGFLLAGVFTSQQGDEMTPAAEGESLVPSGMELLSPSTGATTGLVVDAGGALWALERPGRLVRFDPDTHETMEWTLADDIAFGQAASITPSAKGGVWLVGPDAARLFDGDRFARVIEAPEALTLAVEADDGSLWAATEDGAVLHWDGSSWEDVGPGGWVLALEVDSAGRPWIGGGNRVMVFDGSEWIRFDGSDALPLGKWPRSIMEMADGSIWVASEGGLARFDGTAWTVETPADGHPYSSLAALPDGSIWTRSDNRTGRVWRSDGAEWTKLDGPRGLPEVHGPAELATIGERLFLGTDEGTYERMGDSWELAWDVAPTGPGSPRLLATGGDELWVVDARGARHVQDGTLTDALEWKNQVSDPSPDWFLRDLALGTDGTVWVAGPDGVAYRDGERWQLIDDRKAGAIAVDEGGTVWAARSVQAGGCRLWTLREEDGAWVRDGIDGCPLRYAGDLSLAVDGDGAVWLGSTGGWLPGGLARYSNGEWEAIKEIDDTEIHGAVVLGADDDGAVWIVSQLNLGTENSIKVARGSMARFDDGDVVIVEFPAASGREEPIVLGTGMPWTALAADGTPWTMFDRGPARFDGQMWQFLDADAETPWTKVGAVGSDGSVYGVTWEGIEGGDIIRFAASSE